MSETAAAATAPRVSGGFVTAWRCGHRAHHRHICAEFVREAEPWTVACAQCLPDAIRRGEVVVVNPGTLDELITELKP